MKISELAIAKSLLIGVIISATLILYGGVKYLYRDGTKQFKASNINIHVENFSLQDLSARLQQDDPLAYILLGIGILFITQLVRVALAGYIFLWNKELALFAISSLIFLLLFGSILWGFLNRSLSNVI